MASSRCLISALEPMESARNKTLCLLEVGSRTDLEMVLVWAGGGGGGKGGEGQELLKRGAVTVMVTGASKLEGGAGGVAITVGTGGVHDGVELVCDATEEVGGARETLCDEKDEIREEIWS